MLDDERASRAHVDEAIAAAVTEFSDEVTITVHGLACPEFPCRCGARELVIPARDARAVNWWIRKVRWRLTKAQARRR